MIADFAFEWHFWFSLAALVVIGCWVISARLFDFSFFVVLILSQFVVHTWLAYSPSNSMFIFSILFLVGFLGSAGRQRQSQASTQKLSGIERDWIAIAKVYIIAYYVARLSFYPFMAGELMMDERLAAQQENVLLFMLGLAVQPALAACFYSWMRSDGRILKSDLFILILVVIGQIGSGSKGSVATLVLTYFGVASYLGQRILLSKVALSAGAVISGLAVFMLTRLFPNLDLSEITLLIVYRLAANTDSIEYIQASFVDPSEYPYAGVGALFPSLFKRLGYSFEYPPGVWLYGMRYGDWSGFGPNSGILMDYYGNLGWLGLIAALCIGFYVRRARSCKSVVGCSFLAIVLMLVVDIGIFNVSAFVWSVVYVLLRLKYAYIGAKRLSALGSGKEPV